MYLAHSTTPQFKNLNVPILNFKNWKLEQPWFGANFVSGVVIPVSIYMNYLRIIIHVKLQVQGGGLTKAGNLKLTFTEGGNKDMVNIVILNSLFLCMQVQLNLQQFFVIYLKELEVRIFNTN